MNIAENLVKLREEKGFAQNSLAERVGVSRTMITHIERGVKIPSLALAYEIAKALNCTIDDLCREDGS